LRDQNKKKILWVIIIIYNAINVCEQSYFSFFLNKKNQVYNSYVLTSLRLISLFINNILLNLINILIKYSKSPSSTLPSEEKHKIRIKI
jgi:hypothetical protein